MLATTVSPITFMPAGVPLLCHNSTLFWIYKDLFQLQPTQASYLDHMLNTTGILSAMIARGNRVTKPMVGSLTLTPGTVLIFAVGNVAHHSCIATAPTVISGNNQVNWFSTPGVVTGFSTHSVNDIIWGTTLLKRSKVYKTNGHEYDLYAVPEATAKSMVKALFPIGEGVIL